MNEIQKYPTADPAKIPLTMPEMNDKTVSESAEKTGKWWQGANLSDILATTSDVANAIESATNKGDQGVDPYAQPQYNPNRYNSGVDPQSSTKILGMSPLVFTISALGTATLLGLGIWALTRAGKPSK